MAVAVPRQFEIARTAAKRVFDTKTKLAIEIERYTTQMIRRNSPSAFQRIQDDTKLPIRARTIVSYISVATTIGIIDDSLKPTGSVTASTDLSGFTNHLKDCLLPFTRKHGFALDDIKVFISKQLARSPPIEPITPQLLYQKLTPNISEFTFNQCLLMLDELYSGTFRVRSVRTLLHRQALWGTV